MNTGEENSILEYSMFSENKPLGVYFINNHGNINASDSQTAKIEINGDYIPTGDTTFQVTLNSNGQTGETYHTYNITIHKEYDLVYQEWYTGEEEVKTVLQKPELLTRYTYTGREYNRETGQYYYRARTYASGLGRFTGKDKCGYPGYEYVKNNPLSYRDPSGKSVLIGIGCVFIIGSLGYITWVCFSVGDVADPLNIRYSMEWWGIQGRNLWNTYGPKTGSGSPNKPKETDNIDSLPDTEEGRYCKRGFSRCKTCCKESYGLGDTYKDCVSACTEYAKGGCQTQYDNWESGIKKPNYEGGHLDTCIYEFGKAYD